MLPNDTLSTELVYAPFMQVKVAQHSVPLVDYELGGLAIGDPSGGLDVQLWTARYIGNDVVAFDEAGNGTTVITMPGIVRLSMAFDQNMRPLIAYTTLAGSYLYWFDTFLNAFTTTEIPGALFLRLTLDERRFQFLNNSDVILAYNVGNSLRYRQQRDRFLTERTLVADMGTTRLTAIGTNSFYRLQFKLKGDYMQPPPVYGAGEHRYWRILFADNDGSALYDGIEEMEYRATVGGADQTIVGGGGAFNITASSFINGSNAPYMAFGDNIERWLSASAGASWLRYDFVTPVTVKQVSIIGPRTVITASPKDFFIQWSDDDLNWVTALAVTGETGWAIDVPRLFNVP